MVAILLEGHVQKLMRSVLLRSENSQKEFKRARESIRRAAFTESKKQVAQVYNLTQARIAKDLIVRNTDAGVEVRGNRRTITFISYGWRKSAKGLRGKILKGSAPHVFTGSFNARGLAGDVEGVNSLAFYRHGEKRLMKKGRYKGKIREPIKSLHGPSVADALKDTRVGIPLKARIMARAGKELRRRLLRLEGAR
jgi:hypothetical protein